MRTLTAIENDLPAIQDKLALMYSELVDKSKTQIRVNKDKYYKAELYLQAIIRELACPVDTSETPNVELINWYLNEVTSYLVNCKDISYTDKEVITPICDYNRKKYSFWIPGESECIQLAFYVDVQGNKSIQIPLTETTLTATVVSEDYAIIALLWEQVSGPNTAILVGATTNTLTTTGLIAGTYVFKLTATNANTETTYDTATITVLPASAIPFSVFWGYSDGDPVSPELLTLQFHTPLDAGTVLYELNFTLNSNNKFLIVKEPAAEIAKTSWYNTAFNNGAIPDSVFKSPVVIGIYRYYVSRIPVILDSTNYSITFD